MTQHVHDVASGEVSVEATTPAFRAARVDEEAAEAARQLSEAAKYQRIASALAAVDGADLQAFLDRINAQIPEINALPAGVPQAVKDILVESFVIKRLMYKALAAVLIKTDMVNQEVPD